MRMLMRTLSGWMTYATLRATHLGVGRRQVYCSRAASSSPRCVVAWRGSTPPSHREAFSRHHRPPAEPRRWRARPCVRRAAPPRLASSSDDVRQTEATRISSIPLTAGLCREEQKRGTGARTQADQRRLELTKLAVEIASRTGARPRPARTPRAAPVAARPPAPRAPAIPRRSAGDCVTKRSRPVSRGAYHHLPGSTLGGWTVDGRVSGTVLRSAIRSG